jgi:hypothetical protein
MAFTGLDNMVAWPSALALRKLHKVVDSHRLVRCHATFPHRHARNCLALTFWYPDAHRTVAASDRAQFLVDRTLGRDTAQRSKSPFRFMVTIAANCDWLTKWMSGGLQALDAKRQPSSEARLAGRDCPIR